MLSNFEKAFADARKKGLATFSYQGKLYNTKYREERVLDELFKEYPALSNVYNANNTKISMANVDRQMLNKQYGGGGSIEHWFPDNEGAAEFPHPSLGKYNLEFFDSNLFKNTKNMKAAVLLDMLHGMKNDPNFKSLRDEFNNNWAPSEMDFIKQKYQTEGYKDEDLASYIDRTALDSYLRGGLSPHDDATLLADPEHQQYALMYRGLYKENDQPIDPYSPAQRAIIDKMKSYMTTLKY